MSSAAAGTATRAPDLVDPDIYVDDSFIPAFDDARQLGDVFPHPDPSGEYENFWAVTTYAGVRSVLSDHRRFSSSIYENDGTLTGGVMFETYPRTDIRGSVNIPQHLDMPVHADFKKMVAREFMESQIGSLKERIVAVTRAAIDEVRDRREVDFVHDIAAEVPLNVLMEMLGIAPEHRWLPKAMMGPVFGYQDPEAVAAAPAPAEVMYAQFRELLHDICTEKRANPQDDLLSTVALAEIKGRRMTIDEITEFVTGGIVGAGFDTALGAMGMGLHRLLTNPGEFAKLRADPGLLESAIDEMLRVDPPTRQVRRNTREAVEMNGYRIEPDQKVIAFLIGANYDPAVFADPARFDISRSPNRYLTWGHGLHRCLGAHLARAEIRTMFVELLATFPTIELAGEPARNRGIWIGGMKRLPIRYTVA
jgi:alpha-terpineol hydroxylase